MDGAEQLRAKTGFHMTTRRTHNVFLWIGMEVIHVNDFSYAVLGRREQGSGFRFRNF